MSANTNFEPVTPTRRDFTGFKSTLPPTDATIAKYQKRVSRKERTYMQHTAYHVEIEFVVLRILGESWSSEARAKHFNALKGIEQFVRRSMHYVV